MKKILVFLIGILFSVQAFSQVNDTIKNLTLDEVTVTSMYRSNTTDMDELKSRCYQPRQCWTRTFSHV